ncbi:hypothetical protein BSPLISOX_2584, partial [uncultured Gammaproteobacteria bacterium]
PLGNKQKSINYAIASKAFKDSHKMNLSALAWIERDNKIKDNRIVFNGLTYGLVLSPYTGRVWLDRNLGATRVAASSADTEARGYYYQWGRNDDGHEFSSRTEATAVQAASITPATNKFITTTSNLHVGSDWVTTTIDRNGSLRTAAWADGGVNDICPVGFSVPTKEEIKKDTVDTYNSGEKAVQAFNSFLKITGSGYRNLNNRYNHSAIHLWTRSANASSLEAYYLHLSGQDSSVQGDFSRGLGIAVRCIKDI